MNTLAARFERIRAEVDAIRWGETLAATDHYGRAGEVDRAVATIRGAVDRALRALGGEWSPEG